MSLDLESNRIKLEEEKVLLHKDADVYYGSQSHHLLFLCVMTMLGPGLLMAGVACWHSASLSLSSSGIWMSFVGLGDSVVLSIFICANRSYFFSENDQARSIDAQAIRSITVPTAILLSSGHSQRPLDHELSGASNYSSLNLK